MIILACLVYYAVGVTYAIYDWRREEIPITYAVLFSILLFLWFAWPFIAFIKDGLPIFDKIETPEVKWLKK